MELRMLRFSPLTPPTTSAAAARLRLQSAIAADRAALAAPHSGRNAQPAPNDDLLRAMLDAPHPAANGRA